MTGKLLPRSVIPADGTWQRHATSVLAMTLYGDAAAASVAHAPAAPPPELADSALQRAASSDLMSPAAQQMLLLAAHLGSRFGELDEDILAHDLAAGAAADEAAPQPRSGCQHVLSRIAAGQPWWHAAGVLRSGQGSFGSDAAARATAAGLLHQSGPAVAAQLARRAAAVTHAHPDARDAAGAHAAAVAIACATGSQPGARPGDLAVSVAKHARGAQLRASLALVPGLVRDRAAPAKAAAALGDARAAVPAATLALTAFLMHPGDPVAAIRYVLQTGNRCQNAAAMTGALGAAWAPQARIPLTWTLTGAHLQHLKQLAQGLAAAPATTQRRYRPSTSPHTR